MTTLQRILQKSGPLLSSELAEILAKKEKIRINTASQRVSRAKEIQSFKGFFKSNQALYYLPEQVQEEKLLTMLGKAMFEAGRKYWYTLNALESHGGIISKRYLECYTNYPVVPLKRHIPFEEVMKKFVAQNILIFNNDDYIFSPQFSRIISNPVLHRTIELIKDNVIDNFHSLAKNIGLISFNTGSTFAEFGKFRWGFKGVSPIIGLKEGSKFGFVVADILLGKPFYKSDVLFFIEKLKHVLSFKGASRLLPIVIIDDLDKDALHFLKENGVVVGFIKELFGQKYADTLKDLVSVLNNAGASLKSDPEKYLELIKELKKYNEGLANNIKGTFFEFVVGHIHREECQSIDLGREIISNNARHDMDVFATYSSKVVVAECKATKSQVDEEMITEWLLIKIPAFRNWLLSQEILTKKQFEFEYWATNGFTEKAKELLDEAKSSASKYKVSYFGPQELRTKAIEMKNKKLKEALDNYFFKTAV